MTRIVIPLSPRLRAALAGTVATIALALGVPAAAQACTAGETSTPFAPYGDGASYFLAPGGAFSSGAPGWSLWRAHVDGETVAPALVPGSHPVDLEAGGAAVSPWICVSTEFPTFRALEREASGSASGRLNVTVEWLDLLGLVHAGTGVASLAGGPAWQPTAVMRLSSAVPLLLPGLSAEVRLVFRPADAAPWQLTDVYIDPYRR